MAALFRRKSEHRVTLPDSWARIIRSRVPYAAGLDEKEMETLKFLVAAFIRKIRFEGCRGMAVNDEVRVVIAAQACLLILGGANDAYSGLRSVLVYPDTFIAPSVEREGEWMVNETEEARSGEFWTQGHVVLSWDDVLFSVSRPRDGYNVVFHEFAHLIDHKTGASQGMEGELHASAFKKAFFREYRKLAEARNRRGRTWLDSYGAESPAEFFAVATEFFFECGGDLKARHPGLYSHLKTFYGQETAKRMHGR
jgi:Mlc titration factor MtfA (ptsG expression regulator)